MKKTVLRAEDLSIYFGGLQAVNKVNFHIKENQIVGLIGPNGAGKTTIFNLLTGVYLPTDGDILLDEVSIKGVKPYLVNQKGIARTFQNIRLFKDISVIDNIKLAMGRQVNYSLLSGVFRGKKYQQQERAISRKAHEYLGLFGMDGTAHWPAKNLPYGQQRKLEILRALEIGRAHV